MRRHGQTDRGTPDARNVAMLRLADHALSNGDPLPAMSTIDPTALDGLRRDGLLLSSADDPFRVVPEFAHDEVRRYALARLLLVDADPTVRLIRANVPRWTMGSARLACQVLLSAASGPRNPLHGRYSRLRAVFDALVDAGRGARWGDVPDEALLTIDDPAPVLRDAWRELRANSDAGLRRLSRLVDQRLRNELGLVRALEVESLIALLLDDAAPWAAGDHVQRILREWLRAHIVAKTPAGHPLRERLRERLVDVCTAADQRTEAARNATAAAERAPEESEAERYRPRLSSLGYTRRRRARPRIPSEITDHIVVELLALLGPDLGHAGEAVLRRIGRDAPSRVAPAVEENLTGHALALYGGGFLAEITAAYYLDDDNIDASRFHAFGMRAHQRRSGAVFPLSAWHRGPFVALFRTDFRRGFAVVNRLLDHAALSYVRSRTGSRFGAYEPVPGDQNLAQYRIELTVTGARRSYIGNAQVWSWYRGIGPGPPTAISHRDRRHAVLPHRCRGAGHAHRGAPGRQPAAVQRGARQAVRPPGSRADRARQHPPPTAASLRPDRRRPVRPAPPARRGADR